MLSCAVWSLFSHSRVEYSACISALLHVPGTDYAWFWLLSLSLWIRFGTVCECVLYTYHPSPSYRLRPNESMLIFILLFTLHFIPHPRFCNMWSRVFLSFLFWCGDFARTRTLSLLAAAKTHSNNLSFTIPHLLHIRATCSATNNAHFFSFQFLMLPVSRSRIEAIQSMHCCQFPNKTNKDII